MLRSHASHIGKASGQVLWFLPYLEVLQSGEDVGLVSTLITLDEWVEDLLSVHSHGPMTLVTLEPHLGVIHVFVHGPVILACLQACSIY